MMGCKSFCLLPALAALLALAGCEEDRAFFIYQNQVPQEGCSVTTDDSVYRPEGVLDVSLGRGYVLFPLLRNDLPRTQEAGSGSELLDRNALRLREFRVEVELGAGLDRKFAEELLRSVHPTSGVMLPGDRRASVVQVIKDELVQQLEVPAKAEPRVLVRVQAVAAARDRTVTSLDFFYPIRLCDGCLVRRLASCPTTADDPLLARSNVCGIPQDGPLVCCNDAQQGLVCFAGGSD